MRLGLIVPILLLALALVGLAIVTALFGRRNRLAERVEAAMPQAAQTPTPLPRSGSIIRVRPLPSPGWRVLHWAFRMPIDLPLAHVISPFFVLIGTAAIGLAVAWGSHLIVSWWLSVLDALVTWFFVTRGIFGWELDRYRNLLLRQLPDTIHLVVSATRAGLPVSEAFKTVTDEMASPTSVEFGRVVDEMSVGVSADDALLSLHRRTGVTEYAIFAVTIGVQARSGGRLAETISNLAETVRDRIAIAGKAHAVSAEARTSAIIMTVLPILTAVMLAMVRPGYLRPLLDHPTGRTMSFAGLVTLALGILTMRQMIRGAVRD